MKVGVFFIFIVPCIITYGFFNVTNEMQLVKILLLSLLYIFRALLAHHQDLTKIVRAVYISCMFSFLKLLMMGEKCPKHVQR